WARSTTPRRTSPCPATQRASASYSPAARSRRSRRDERSDKKGTHAVESVRAFSFFSLPFSVGPCVPLRIRGGERPASKLARGVLFRVSLSVLGPQAADLQAILHKLAAHAEVPRHLNRTQAALHQPAHSRERHERRCAHGVRGLLVRL